MKGQKFVKKGFMRIGAVMLVLLLVLMLPVRTLAADEDENATTYDWYTLAGVAARALDDAYLNANTDVNINNVFGMIPASGAGGLLGYEIHDGFRGIFGGLQTFSSYSSNRITYKHLFALSDSFVPYATLGTALSEVGLDNTTADFSMTPMRTISGGLMMVAYAAAESISGAFRTAIGFLQTINPFSWFAGVAGGMFSSLQSNNSSSALTQFVSGIYGFLTSDSFAYVIIAIIAAYMIVSVLLFRNRSKFATFSAWKRVAIRLVFVTLGVPLLGVTYTTVLGWIGNGIGGGTSAATKMVASTFCDFEGFVINGDFDLNGISSITATIEDGSRIKIRDGINVSQMCYSMNRKANPSLQSNYLAVGQDSTGVASAVASIQTEFGDINTRIAGGDKSGNEAESKWVYDVLVRYMNNNTISSADYASVWMANNWIGKNNADIQSFIASSSTVENYKDPTNGAYKQNGRFNSNSDINPFAGGSSGGSSMPVQGQVSISSSFKMSPMSVYNYLNTYFTDKGLYIYSSENSSSEAVRRSHTSVNLAGKGLSGLTNYLICISLLMCYAVLGWFYAFSLIVGNIKHGISIIMSVPLAMMGSVRRIAKIITLTAVMILEVIGTIIAYLILSELLFALATGFVMRASTVITAAIGLSTYLLGPLIGLLVVIFIIWFTIVGMRFRKTICKGLEEISDNIINQFILDDPNAGANPAPQKRPGALSGAAAGAMMGLRVAGAAATGGASEAGVKGVEAAGSVKDVVEGKEDIGSAAGKTAASAAGMPDSVSKLTGSGEKGIGNGDLPGLPNGGSSGGGGKGIGSDSPDSAKGTYAGITSTGGKVNDRVEAGNSKGGGKDAGLKETRSASGNDVPRGGVSSRIEEPAKTTRSLAKPAGNVTGGGNGKGSVARSSVNHTRSAGGGTPSVQQQAAQTRREQTVSAAKTVAKSAALMGGAQVLSNATGNDMYAQMAGFTMATKYQQSRNNNVPESAADQAYGTSSSQISEIQQETVVPASQGVEINVYGSRPHQESSGEAGQLSQAVDEKVRNVKPDAD